MMKKKFTVKGMSCAACQAHIEQAVRKLDGVTNVSVSLLNNSMKVEYDDKNCSVEKIELAVQQAGYEACPIDQPNRAKEQRDSHEIRNEIIKIAVSFFFLFILMYISMGHMVGLPLPSFLEGRENAVSFALTQLLLTLPSLLLFSHYFIDGYRQLFKLSPNMNSLIALGATASIAYGIFALYMIGYGLGHNNLELVDTYRHNLYFESAAMILTLVSLGKLFEKISKKKTTKAIEKLIDLTPKTASILVDGQEITKPANEVQIGDVVVCRRGDLIPVDGIIIDGVASIDEANMTGESIPVSKKSADHVYSSTIIANGYIKIRAEKVGENTSINTIIRLVDEASNSKAPISKLVDKVSLYFVPTIIVIAILTLIGFLLAGYGFELSFNFAISVLVIACPCALGLATPVAVMVGVGKGAQNGLIIKNAEILEKMHNVKTVVFDKTGTISSGKPIVTDYIVLRRDENLENIICEMEKLSKHPLATAIVQYFDNSLSNIALNIDDYLEVDGQGIKAKVNGQNYAIGNHKMFDKQQLIKCEKSAKNLEKHGKTVIFVSKNNEILSILALRDEIKPTAKATIQQLKKLGIKTVMLTGDNASVASAIAQEVGIEKVYSEVMPIDKANIIQSLKTNKKHLVAMVGDGVNDAIALTCADLGIAVGAGSDVAIESADIVLVHNDLLDIVNAYNLSRLTFRIIVLNLFWAFFYNCLGVLLACGLFYPLFGIKLNPMIASLAMSLSSVFVVSNALCINFFKPIQKTKKQKGEQHSMETIHIDIEGMMCEHCQKRVEEALLKVEGVSRVIISLKQKCADVEGVNLNRTAIINAVNDAGYKAK